MRAVESVRVSLARLSICCLNAPDVFTHSRSSLSTLSESGFQCGLCPFNKLFLLIGESFG